MNHTTMVTLSSKDLSYKPNRIYAVGGGKGGTGKSFLTASLGIILAKLGKKVLLIDLDLGASNLHTFLALKKPPLGLKQYLNKKVDKIDDIAIPTVEPNLSIITSIGCSLEVANLYHAQKVKIIRAIRKLHYDYILLDLGSGTHFNTLDLFLISNEGLLITNPEPVSIENMFRFIKSIYLRRMKMLIKSYGLNIIFKEVLHDFRDMHSKSPSDLIRLLKRYDSDKGIEIENKIKDLKIKLILNQFKWQVDRNFGHHIAEVCKRHLYFNYQFLGTITYDNKVSDATMNTEIYLDKYRNTRTYIEIHNIANRIIEDTCAPPRPLSLAS